MIDNVITHETMLQLKRWITPSVYNGWEVISKRHPLSGVVNLEPVVDYMPEMGVMVGRAVTVLVQPSNPSHKANTSAWDEYRRYIAQVSGPKIVIVQDLDKPNFRAAFWGEVTANVHRALGCVGTIIDGAIRDVDDMHNAGFKAIAKQLAVNHAFGIPISWGHPVEVFGTVIEPGQLIHADKHGFIAIPSEDEMGLVDAVTFMDRNECNTVLRTARNTTGLSVDELLTEINKAGKAFKLATEMEYDKKGEW